MSIIMRLHVLPILIGGMLAFHGNSYAADPATNYYVSQTESFQLNTATTVTRTFQTTVPEKYLRGTFTSLKEPNASIVRLLWSYPQDGSSDYWWPKKNEAQFDGSTTDVLLNGQLVLKGEPKGRSFCCGLTLEVFYRYLKDKPKAFSHIPADKYNDFKGLWFCKKIFSPGPADALTAFNLGKVIEEPEDALPGDFIQLWRTNKSGHSVIFINWLRDKDNKRIGLQYWSTQPATKGIGFRSELFGNLPGASLVDPDKLSVVRPSVIN